MGVLYSASKEIKSWITEQPVNEESLTSWMLRNISKNKENFQYYLFNKHQEAINGADWLWCIKTNPYIYLFLVQAKKIKKTPCENFRGLNQHAGSQINNLLSKAKAKALFPIYIFYTNETHPTKCLSPQVDEGVFLASAYAIKNLFNAYRPKNSSNIYHKPISPTSTKTLLSYSIGLSCLEDCPLIKSSSGDSTCFEKFFTRYLVEKIEIFENNIGNEGQMYRYTQDEVPRYIKTLPPMNPNGQGKSLPDWYEEEFSEEIQNLNGVVIFDYSSKYVD